MDFRATRQQQQQRYYAKTRYTCFTNIWLHSNIKYNQPHVSSHSVVHGWCTYYLKIAAHTSQKNAHLLYRDRPGTNAIHCQTRKKRRNALCWPNVEILLKPNQVHSSRLQHRECITAINNIRAPPPPPHPQQKEENVPQIKTRNLPQKKKTKLKP